MRVNIVTTTYPAPEDGEEYYDEGESTMEELNLSAHEIAEKIGCWMPSQSHLEKCRDLSRVWFTSDTEADMWTGETTVKSLHIPHDASPAEKRAWGRIIRITLL